MKPKSWASFDVELVRSSNYKPLTTKSGYQWFKDKSDKNGIIAFHCVVKMCSSRGVASEALDYFDERQPHNPSADLSKIEVRERRNILKTAVRLGQLIAPLKRLYNQAFADVQDVMTT